MQNLRIMDDALLLEYMKRKNIKHSIDKNGFITVNHPREFALYGYDVYNFQKLVALSDCQVLHTGTENRFNRPCRFVANSLKKLGHLKCNYTKSLELNAVTRVKSIESYSLKELVLPVKKIGDILLAVATKLHINSATQVNGAISAENVTDFSADLSPDIHGDVFLSPDLRGVHKNGIHFGEEYEDPSSPNVSMILFAATGKVKQAATGMRA